jgi:prevent-host-death family protein
MGKLLELPDGGMRAGVATCGDPFVRCQRISGGVEAAEARAVPRCRRCEGGPIAKPQQANLVADIEIATGSCYCRTMKTMTARDANQNFSKVLAEVEQGETVLITKNGKTVAELRPRADDPREDPVWRANFERMMALMATWEDTGYRVGKITEEDKYGDAPV